MSVTAFSPLLSERGPDLLSVAARPEAFRTNPLTRLA